MNNSNSKIIAGSRCVACVHECHILLVNFNGQQQNKSFDVTEKQSLTHKRQPEIRLRLQAKVKEALIMLQFDSD